MTKSRRRLALGLSIAAAIAGVVVAIRVTGFQVLPFASRCSFDGEIAPDERDAIGRTAVDFAGRVMGPDPASAYAMLAPSARTGMTAEQLQTNYKQRQTQIGPIADWSVRHVYVVKLDGATDIQQGICGLISRPDERVAVAIKPGPAQAHVLLEGQSPHNTVAFALWMVNEDREWRLLEAHLRPAGYMGKTAAEFEDLAKAEQRDRHFLSAALLYVEAQLLADRGPRLQLGILQRIGEELRSVKVPGPLAGDAPFNWNVGDSHFKVLNVAPTGLDDGHGHDKLWVVVSHEIDPWVDDGLAERKNQELLAAFRTTYPSYRRFFAGLVVRGLEKARDGGARGWGTVHRDDEAGAGDSLSGSSSGDDAAQ